MSSSGVGLVPYVEGRLLAPSRVDDIEIEGRDGSRLDRLRAEDGVRVLLELLLYRQRGERERAIRCMRRLLEFMVEEKTVDLMRIWLMKWGGVPIVRRDRKLSYLAEALGYSRRTVTNEVNRLCGDAVMGRLFKYEKKWPRKKLRYGMKGAKE